MIGRCKLVALSFLGLCVSLFSSCAPQGSGLQSYAPVAAQPPGTARVWFVHTKDPQEQFGDPIIYANGQQLGRALPGVAFYHDFPPGTYTFTVQSYGLTAGQALQKDVVQLAPGTQTYLEVLWGGSWLVGSAGGATFLVRTLVPSLGPAYVKMLTDGGPPPGALASPGTRSCPSGSRPRRTAPRRANLRNQAALETTDGVA